MFKNSQDQCLVMEIRMMWEKKKNDVEWQWPEGALRYCDGSVLYSDSCGSGMDYIVCNSLKHTLKICALDTI